MDKSRQQFEEWCSKNKSSTINLFDVWQASRESLEVELPEGFGVHEVWCYTAVSVENALISNGVKIKNE
ncbi:MULTISPECIES: hypothetical protein [unclassified Providencia]|uniref:hypothetical protein n=1 Tax=unclassified Providencia TaxID=2633465 RepID=UPI00234BC089|nr:MULTISPECIES: hypothetical protein [unclassified Providencia]